MGESDVKPEAAHPFWATGFADVAIVHNGQITNYWKMRRRLERRGFEFNTDNVEFNSGTFRGTIYADAGEISGDLIVGGIDAGSITAGTLTLTGSMTVNTGGGSTMIDSADQAGLVNT